MKTFHSLTQVALLLVYFGTIQAICHMAFKSAPLWDSNLISALASVSALVFTSYGYSALFAKVTRFFRGDRQQHKKTVA